MTDKAITRHSPADPIERAKSALEAVFKSWVEESPDDLEFLDQQIADFNQCVIDIDKSADGRNGAPLDEYSQGAPLPTPEDPEYKDAVDRWIALHPGTSRSEALNHVMYMLGHDQKEAA